jgi:hypothetical protein
MHGRQISGVRRRRRHGSAPYLILGLLLLLLSGAPALAAPRLLRLAAKPVRFEVRVAGRAHTFHFTTIAGCHYRLTVEGGSLRRPILEIGRPDEAAFASADAGPGSNAAVHMWYAERDALLEARVRGFSAMTGDGRIRFEALDAGGTPIGRHRRYLALTDAVARVGELLVGEPNTWELVVEQGAGYEITPTSGTAGRVRVQVLDWSDEVIADSEKTGVSWLARPPLRFRVPARPAADENDGPPPAKKRPKKGAARRAPSMRAVVRGVFDGGGTYGLKLRRLADGEDVELPTVDAAAPVERGAVKGEAHAFRAGPGDLAMIYSGHSPDVGFMVQVLRGERWVGALEDIGRGNAARSPEDALTRWFQPWYPGTYRFVPVPMAPREEPQLFLMDRADLGGAPIHMGTGSDPTPRARIHGTWRLVALGVVMPGKDYLFVCVHAPDRGVAMRVRNQAGKVLVTRPAGADTISPGLGPSLRFKVARPGIYRLEARSTRRRTIRPLLRRASN